MKQDLTKRILLTPLVADRKQVSHFPVRYCPAVVHYSRTCMKYWPGFMCPNIFVCSLSPSPTDLELPRSSPCQREQNLKSNSESFRRNSSSTSCLPTYLPYIGRRFTKSRAKTLNWAFSVHEISYRSLSRHNPNIDLMLVLGLGPPVVDLLRS